MADFQNYTIIKKLGEGTSGETFLAEKNGEQFAIKQLKIGELDKWKTIKRFHREAKILKKLNHPAIPQYIEFIEDELTLAIVQQYIPGESFYQLIQHEKRFTTPELKDILKQGLELLTHLEKQKIIHRDLSPKNIILDPDGKLWFVDFGAVQRALTDRNSTITTMGTFGYMAPEQIMGNTTHQSDLYSFGMSLIALISGKSIDQLPEDPMSGTLAEEVFDNLPSELQYVLKKMVEVGVKKRFQNTTEIILELNDPANHSRSHYRSSKPIRTYYKEGIKIDQGRTKTEYVFGEANSSLSFIELFPKTFYFNLIVHLVIINLILHPYITINLLGHLILSLMVTFFHLLIFFLNNRINPISHRSYSLEKSKQRLSFKYHSIPLWEYPVETFREITFTKTAGNIYLCELSSTDHPFPLYCHHFQTPEAAQVIIDELKKSCKNLLEVKWI